MNARGPQRRVSAGKQADAGEPPRMGLRLNAPRAGRDSGTRVRRAIERTVESAFSLAALVLAVKIAGLSSAVLAFLNEHSGQWWKVAVAFVALDFLLVCLPPW